MRFAEFYHLSTGWNGTDFSGPKKPIPACGDRSVLILDGRWNESRAAHEARIACRARGYIGFTLHAGEAFTRSRETRGLELVS